jgi:hypothetical protein
MTVHGINRQKEGFTQLMPIKLKFNSFNFQGAESALTDPINREKAYHVYEHI